MAVRIQLRRDTAANWSSANPTLRAGEIGIETDTLKFKIGNGSSPWNSITAYANVVPSDLNTTLNGYLETGDIGAVNGVVGLNADQDAIIPGAAIIFEGETPDSYETTLIVADPTGDRTVTIPDATTTLVGTDVAQTLTNKTITSPSISGLTLSDASIVFEGITADSYETTLTAGDPTDDHIITLPNATGTVALTTNIPSNTDGLSEGATNKYFTDERAQDAIGNSIGNGLDYDDGTGAISVDPSEFALSAVGAPTTDVSMASYKITNLATPTSANDAANKAYVDNTTAGLNFHAAVHAATTANLDATYNNGTSGVGATLTANANGALVVDGHTLNADERVLVKNQSTGLQNGIYVVTAVGDESNPWVLTRATDADNSPSGEVAYGDFTFVQQGSTNAGFGFILNTTGTITIGTTAISYVQFNAGQAVVAGNGLTETSPGTLAINTAITADLSTAQTFTNKTLTSPVISSITNTGTITLPTSTDTLVGRATTDTLTNKTISGANNTLTVRLANDVSGTLPIGNGGTNITTYAAGDILYASATDTLSKLTAGTNGHILTLSSGLPTWAAAPVSLPSQSGNAGKYLTTNGTTASWGFLVVPIQTGFVTLTTNTATFISTADMPTFTSIEYMISLKQGSKVRTSKVIMQTDGTSVDMTEFAITETGGTMSGVVISATTSGSDAVLQATVTDAASTNVDVRFSMVKL